MLEKIKKYTHTPEYAAKQEEFRQRIAIPGTIGARLIVEVLFLTWLAFLLVILLFDAYDWNWSSFLYYLVMVAFEYPAYRLFRRLFIFLLTGLQATSITYQIRLSSGKISGKE